MYKKVELNGDEVLKDGGIIGKVIKRFDGGVEIRLTGRIGIRFAFYGVIDNRGDFHQYCRNNNCNKKCKFTQRPSCRINQKYSKKGGLYINIWNYFSHFQHVLEVAFLRI